MSKHTPGPWYVTKNPTWLIRSTPGKCAVGKATEQFMDRAERDANARLMAAAPTMLEALKAAKGYMLNAKIDLQTGTKKETTLATLEGGIKNLEAAIALAEGE